MVSVEELMEERGVELDHATIHRWVLKYSSQLEEKFHPRKRPVGRRWRMDETYIRGKGEWRYLYGAVDKTGQTIDFLLTEHRDTEAALRFLRQAISRHGVPETITIDGSEVNEAAIKRYNEAYGTHILGPCIPEARMGYTRVPAAEGDVQYGNAPSTTAS